MIILGLPLNRSVYSATKKYPHWSQRPGTSIQRPQVDNFPFSITTHWWQGVGKRFSIRYGNALFRLNTQTPCFHTEKDYIFQGIPKQFPVGRYHSWVVSDDGLPSCLEVTAVSPEGQIMALRHREYDIHGIQFHPESVLTPNGRAIVENFLGHTLCP